MTKVICFLALHVLLLTLSNEKIQSTCAPMTNFNHQLNGQRVKNLIYIYHLAGSATTVLPFCCCSSSNFARAFPDLFMIPGVCVPKPPCLQPGEPGKSSLLASPPALSSKVPAPSAKLHGCRQHHLSGPERKPRCLQLSAPWLWWWTNPTRERVTACCHQQGDPWPSAERTSSAIHPKPSGTCQIV